MTELTLLMRDESRPTERRAPLSPETAGKLIREGVAISVERSSRRVFGDEEYAAAGCALVPPGSWPDAPEDVYVVGLKELPDRPHLLRHRHIFFGHAYKDQPGSVNLLRRFTEGGGTLLDLESLVDERGRRVAAFGYWAGYVGAALAVLRHRGALVEPLTPTTRGELDKALAENAEPLRALVIGALGRCGSGAGDALVAAGAEVTRWDLAETENLDVAALLDHDVLVNAVLATGPIPPFVTTETLRRPRRLSVIADVTCDVGSPCHTLPIYDRTTTWQDPVLQRDGLDVIAIDNLPSLVPREATVDFAADLAPHLAVLDDSGVWRRAEAAFTAACASHDLHRKEDHA
ncbi:saccharopine dehydrogenase [Amycolatopsis thailandensis]|uniref:Saccharopine dehydrogenase [NAD(+), L-lysine-forming] n=1 Tax=Amycolatopsis thailandensis TaxID=589330 RepID=A0A229REM1_9PSEU|nr:saccharopine dehydrogenase [Amycolatopsis thailandensis]OXM45096.1 saccharopine dehydrogenase [Amycolatopsis thailandensis]